MKIAVYQFAPAFGKKTENLDRFRQDLSSLECDLVVLPEMAFTGYQFVSQEEVASLAEGVPNGETCVALVELAIRNRCFIVCGLPEKANGKFYNTAILVGPEGFIGKYRKLHLFFEEKKLFTPGDTGFEIFNIGLAKIGIMICFDWIFPEAARILSLKGAQIIVQPANLVLPWCQKVALARALENKVFFLTANRTGVECRGDKDELKFTGQSQIVSPSGEILFRLGEDEEAGKVVEIDPSDADNKQVTPYNHVLDDRRPELYGRIVE